MRSQTRNMRKRNAALAIPTASARARRTGSRSKIPTTRKTAVLIRYPSGCSTSAYKRRRTKPNAARANPREVGQETSASAVGRAQSHRPNAASKIPVQRGEMRGPGQSLFEQAGGEQKCRPQLRARQQLSPKIAQLPPTTWHPHQVGELYVQAAQKISEARRALKGPESRV